MAAITIWDTNVSPTPQLLFNPRTGPSLEGSSRERTSVSEVLVDKPSP
jgi:hypothetical protein